METITSYNANIEILIHTMCNVYDEQYLGRELKGVKGVRF